MALADGVPSLPQFDSPASADADTSTSSTSRRRFLAGVTATTALGTAGCLGVFSGEDGAGSPGGPADWQTYRGDSQRTGLAAADAGPGESLSLAWETSIFDVIEAREGVSAQGRTEENATDGHTAYGQCREVTLTDDLVLTSVSYRLFEGEEQQSAWAGVVAMDPGSGSIEWTISGVGGMVQAPTVIDDRLYLWVLYPIDADVDGSHLLVADAATGDVEARRPLPGSRRDAPTISAQGIYHRAPYEADRNVVGIDRETADRDWIADVPRALPRHQPFTVADGSMLYSGQVDDETQALVALDPETGDEQWRREIDRPPWPPAVAPGYLGVPSVVDGTGYVAGRWEEFQPSDIGGSALRAFDLDGGDDEWTFRPDGVPLEEVSSRAIAPGCAMSDDCEIPDQHSALHGIPLVVDDLVIVPGFGQPAADRQSHEYHRHLYAVSRSDGSLQWTIPGAFASPVAAGDVIYARLVWDAVIAISTDGTVLDRVGIEDEPSWGRSPAIGHGRVYTAWGLDDTQSPQTPARIAAIE